MWDAIRLRNVLYTIDSIPPLIIFAGAANAVLTYRIDSTRIAPVHGFGKKELRKLSDSIRKKRVRMINGILYGTWIRNVI